MDQQIVSRPARRRGMSDLQVARLRKKAKRYIVADPELRGMYVRVPPVGPNVFVCVARDGFGKQVWHTIGAADAMKIEDAREAARAAIKRIKAGEPAAEPAPVAKDSFQAVAENWLKRVARPKGLRTVDEIARCLAKYVYPHFGERPFEGIRRGDVTRLLDHVEDNHGPRQADVCLTIVRSIANWHATRNEDYVTPIVRGMKRDQAGARERILDDDEIRALWRATESGGVFNGLVRVLLTTAQRYRKCVTMKWDDVDADGVWHVPQTSKREKGSGGDLKLPALALDVIRAQPRQASNDFVFAGATYGRPFNNPSLGKRQLDAKLGFKTPFVLHDLRRCSRSLLARAGVPDRHAEAVLGHTVGTTVEQIYNRHPFFDEKAAALQRLANLIETIVDPPAGNVRQLKRR
jgi:integrase